MHPAPRLPKPATHYHALWSQIEAKIAAILSAIQQHQNASPQLLSKAAKALRRINTLRHRLAKIAKLEAQNPTPAQQTQSPANKTTAA